MWTFFAQNRFSWYRMSYVFIHKNLTKFIIVIYSITSSMYSLNIRIIAVPTCLPLFLFKIIKSKNNLLRLNFQKDFFLSFPAFIYTHSIHNSIVFIIIYMWKEKSPPRVIGSSGKRTDDCLVVWLPRASCWSRDRLLCLGHTPLAKRQL